MKLDIQLTVNVHSHRVVERRLIDVLAYELPALAYEISVRE